MFPDPALMQLVPPSSRLKKRINKWWMGREAQVHIFRSNFADEFGVDVGFQIPLGHFFAVALAGFSKRSANVGDFVDFFVWIIGIAISGIVVVREVPVIDERHHYPQAVEL